MSFRVICPRFHQTINNSVAGRLQVTVLLPRAQEKKNKERIYVLIILVCFRLLGGLEEAMPLNWMYLIKDSVRRTFVLLRWRLGILVWEPRIYSV